MAESSLSDDEIKVMEQLGYFYLNIGLLDSAARCIRALLAVAPDNHWAHNAEVILAYDMGQYEEVIHLTRNLGKANVADPEVRELLKVRARALYKHGDHQEAARVMNLALGPGTVEQSSAGEKALEGNSGRRRSR